MVKARSSVFTQGLESIKSKSTKLDYLVTELYNLDDKLQDAHHQAKLDDEFGEEVVQTYLKFLEHRSLLIKELEKEKISVPWNLKMKVDDLELTLRQRKEQGIEDTPTLKKATNSTEQEKQSAIEKTAPETNSTMSTVLPLSIIVLAIAYFAYQLINFSKSKNL